MDEIRHGGRLPDPGMGAICGRCAEPRLAHSGPNYLGACPGESGLYAKRFSIAPEDRPQPETVASPARLPLPSCAVTGMGDPLAWLRAQLDDDERVARDAAETERGGQWRADHEDMTAHVLSATGHAVAYQDSLSDAEAEHVARWDPARVLAEVDTKRKMLDWLEMWDDRMLNDNYWPWDSTDAVQLLAQPYAGRDGWREEWRA